MVLGIERFREWFKGFEDQYAIIGGTACDLLMSEEGLEFRGTKDIDLVLIVEAVTAEFGLRFWEFVREAGYVRRYNSYLLTKNNDGRCSNTPPGSHKSRHTIPTKKRMLPGRAASSAYLLGSVFLHFQHDFSLFLFRLP